MTALTTTSLPYNNLTGAMSAPQGVARFSSMISGLDEDSRTLASILVRTLFILGLGALGILAVTGQPPLLLLPLALFLFFGSCMQWRHPRSARAHAERGPSSGCALSFAPGGPFCGYEDKA